MTLQKVTTTCVGASLIACFAMSSPAAAQVNLSKSEEAAALSQAARAKFKEQRFGVCAAMYREAFGLDRGQVGYLYSAALCEQKATNFAAAERDYRTVLGLVGPEHALAGKARGHIAEVRAALVAKQQADAHKRKVEREKKLFAEAAARKQRAAQAKSAAAAKARQKAAGNVSFAPQPSWQRPVSWASIGLGIVAAGIGGFLLVDGMSDMELLQKDLEKTENGLIVGVHRDDARSRQEDAQGKQKLGGGVVAVGVGIAAVGAWLIAPTAVATKPLKATLAPTLGRPGFVATLRF